MRSEQLYRGKQPRSAIRCCSLRLPEDVSLETAIGDAANCFAKQLAASPILDCRFREGRYLKAGLAE
jgi:hypothetical protein